MEPLRGDPVAALVARLRDIATFEQDTLPRWQTEVTELRELVDAADTVRAASPVAHRCGHAHEAIPAGYPYGIKPIIPARAGNLTAAMTSRVVAPFGSR